MTIEASTRALGRALSAQAFVLAKLEWNRFGRAMAAFHQRYSLYLTPITATLPLPIGYFKQSAVEKTVLKTISKLRLGKLLLKSGIVDKMAMKSLEKYPFTQLANLTGQPAMSVPLYWNADNLPCGVQFMAPIGDEKTLLSLAGQFEQARPWMHKCPPSPQELEKSRI